MKRRHFLLGAPALTLTGWLPGNAEANARPASPQSAPTLALKDTAEPLPILRVLGIDVFGARVIDTIAGFGWPDCHREQTSWSAVPQLVCCRDPGPVAGDTPSLACIITSVGADDQPAAAFAYRHAQHARDAGALVIAIVGRIPVRHRAHKQAAQRSLARIRAEADVVFEFAVDRSGEAAIVRAAECARVLVSAIAAPGLVGVDLAGIRTVLAAGAGRARFATAIAAGHDAPERAVDAAIAEFGGAARPGSRHLLSIHLSPEHAPFNWVRRATQHFGKHVDDQAKRIFSAHRDARLEAGQIRVGIASAAPGDPSRNVGQLQRRSAMALHETLLRVRSDLWRTTTQLAADQPRIAETCRQLSALADFAHNLPLAFTGAPDAIWLEGELEMLENALMTGHYNDSIAGC